MPTDQPIRLAKATSNLFRPREPSPGLDVAAFSTIFEIDSAAGVAEIGGMATYESIVAATLPRGFVPLCVPQLKTITLGGAVAGLGIESASWRNGCPHESVLEMDILTGTGDVVTATNDPANVHADLFAGFPNSYGSLGYALRLKISLERVTPYVSIEHVRVGGVHEAAQLLASITASGEFDGDAVDFLDGVVFGPHEAYVSVARYTEDSHGQQPSDRRKASIYYRSIQTQPSDLLTTYDYLWRWDTDWFWCSRAFGAQHPLIRPWWPEHLLRSDVYWRLVNFNRRTGLSIGLDMARRRPEREPVVQDIEVPIDRLGDFMAFLDREVGITPVWLCPLRQRDPARLWPLYDFDPDTTYINVGFWATVTLPDGATAEAGRINRRIESIVTELGGRKSLYSTSYYSREEFDRIYGGDAYRNLKRRYDPQSRLTDLYAKTVLRR